MRLNEKQGGNFSHEATYMQSRHKQKHVDKGCWLSLERPRSSDRWIKARLLARAPDFIRKRPVKKDNLYFFAADLICG